MVAALARERIGLHPPLAQLAVGRPLGQVELLVARRDALALLGVDAAQARLGDHAALVEARVAEDARPFPRQAGAAGGVQHLHAHARRGSGGRGRRIVRTGLRERLLRAVLAPLEVHQLALGGLVPIGERELGPQGLALGLVLDVSEPEHHHRLEGVGRVDDLGGFASGHLIDLAEHEGGALIAGQAIAIDLLGNRVEDMLIASPLAMFASLSESSRTAGNGARSNPPSSATWVFA